MILKLHHRSILSFSLAIGGLACANDHHEDHATTKNSTSKKEDVHWSYEGKTGPEHWGKLSNEWDACLHGNEQSPIDLKWKKPNKERSIGFHYNSSPAEILDNGHTIQVNLKPGSKVDLDGRVYDLVQFHFHTSSEHTISGKKFPLELHFVHKDEKGQLAVVGVLFKLGKDNPVIGQLWNQIPHKKGTPVGYKDGNFDPSQLLPTKTTHYHYMGSLTTPPCSEGVNWNVLNTPLEVSEQQIKRFQKLYSNNARPVQLVHERKPANF